LTIAIEELLIHTVDAVDALW